jgi:hypothetical protein
MPSDENAANGVSASSKYTPPHLRSQDKASGAGPGKTTSPKVAYIRVTPRPEAQLEADLSVMSVTYHYDDQEVRVWCACDDEEQNEFRLNRIIWEQLNSSADWFFCHEDGRRQEAGFVIEQGSRI